MASAMVESMGFVRWHAKDAKRVGLVEDRLDKF